MKLASGDNLPSMLQPEAARELLLAGCSSLIVGIGGNDEGDADDDDDDDDRCTVSSLLRSPNSKNCIPVPWLRTPASGDCRLKSAAAVDAEDVPGVP